MSYKILFNGLCLTFLDCRVTFMVMDPEYYSSVKFLAFFQLNESLELIKNNSNIDFMNIKCKKILESFKKWQQFSWSRRKQFLCWGYYFSFEYFIVDFLGHVENIFCGDDIIFFWIFHHCLETWERMKSNLAQRTSQWKVISTVKRNFETKAQKYRTNHFRSYILYEQQIVW